MIKRDGRKIEIIETSKDLDLDFERNVNFQINLILQDLNLLGFANTKSDHSSLVRSIENDIRSLELLLVNQINDYGRKRYMEELNDIQKTIQKVLRQQSEDKENDMLEVQSQIDYLRKKFEVMIRISQTDFSESEED